MVPHMVPRMVMVVAGAAPKIDYGVASISIRSFDRALQTGPASPHTSGGRDPRGAHRRCKEVRGAGRMGRAPAGTAAAKNGRRSKCCNTSLRTSCVMDLSSVDETTNESTRL